MNTAQFALAALISVSSPAFAESAPVLTKTQAIFYTESIKPDIPFVSPERFNDIPNDEKVKAAVKWLKGY